MQFRMSSEPAAPRSGSRIPRPPALRLVWLQLLLGLLVSIIAQTLGGQPALTAALAGTVAAVLPNLVFVGIVFRHSGARAAKRVVADLYLAEACKFLLTVGIFAVVFAGLRPLAAGWVFAAYVVALSAYWFGPWLLAGPTRRTTQRANRAHGVLDAIEENG